MAVKKAINARIMPKWTFALLAALALGIGAYAFVFYGNYDGLKSQGFVQSKTIALPDLWYKVLWVHAASSGVALSIGWIQFVKRIRKRRTNLHRAIGYVYSIMLAVGGVTGLYMAYYSDGGWSGKTGFAMLSLLWLYTLYRSLKSIIVDRDVRTHGRWMTRNYALTCAAITLRIYTGIAAGAFGLTDTNDTFVVIGWLCWVPNLFFAQWLMNRKKVHKPPVTTLQL